MIDAVRRLFDAGFATPRPRAKPSWRYAAATSNQKRFLCLDIPAFPRVPRCVRHLRCQLGLILIPFRNCPKLPALLAHAKANPVTDLKPIEANKERSVIPDFLHALETLT